MKENNTDKLAEQKSLDIAKKDKSTAMINAVLIGLFVGVIVWGVAKNNIGFFGLIVLFFAYRFFNKPKGG